VPNELVFIAVVAGAAAFGAMLIALLRRNRRMAFIWAGVWLVCVVMVGAFFVPVLVDGFWLGGAPSDAQMERLVSELDAAYPGEIEAIGYENALPLDPPALFIDTDRGMTFEDQRSFICEQVRPRVDAVDRRIIVFGTGTTSPDDC